MAKFCILKKITYISGHSGYIALISALGEQRQVDFCELKANLAYIVNSRPVRAT